MQRQDHALGATQPRIRKIFGRRKGKRLRDRPLALLERQLPRLALDLSAGPLEPARLFPTQTSGLVVEIGFGGGEHLAHVAASRPDMGLIGCEPFINGVAKLVTQADALRLDNIRLHVGDGLDLLRALPEASVDCLYLLYPDPWPKRRQRKRRFVNGESLTEIARVLKDGAEFRFASDIDDYLGWTLARVAACEDLLWTAQRASDWLEPWPHWPGTRYEQKARAEGRPLTYLTFSRTARAP